MTNNPQPSNDPPPAKSRLPSPGCLFAVTLLVIVASVGGMLGWRAHRQQARLEYFEQLGASIETEPASPVWLHDFVADTFGEERAAGFTDITALELYDARITDADLRHVGGLTTLRQLVIEDSVITDAGLAHLRGLTHLEALAVGGLQSQITDDGLEHLSGLTNLKGLGLWGPHITDDGLRHLGGLTNLRELFLNDLPVTDDGLRHVSALVNLETLHLRNSQVTDAAVEELQAQMPGVRIHR